VLDAGLARDDAVVTSDFYDGYESLSRDAYRFTERRTRRSGSIEQMRDAAESSIFEIEEALLSVAQRGSAARTRFEADHCANNWFALAALDSMIGMTHAASLMLNDKATLAGRMPPEPIPYAVAALAARALSVSNEICALLRAGFPIGARVRWRTLYEIDVVASVLARGNRSTTARYVNHRWVQLAVDRDRESDPEPWSPESGPSPEVMRRRLVRRYGSTYGGTYGWAAELSRRKLNVKSPAFRHLEEIAELRGHASRVRTAHHGVHADSIGALMTVDASDMFHSGASTRGTAEGCLESVRVLGEIWDALLRQWNNYARDRRVDVIRSNIDELSLVLQRDCFSSMYRRPPPVARAIAPNATPSVATSCTR
jgi:hypothetical protein